MRRLHSILVYKSMQAGQKYAIYRHAFWHCIKLSYEICSCPRARQQFQLLNPSTPAAAAAGICPECTLRDYTLQSQRPANAGQKLAWPHISTVGSDGDGNSRRVINLI